ncbi:MAG: PqqD family protein [Myxococcales bacterium]
MIPVSLVPARDPRCESCRLGDELVVLDGRGQVLRGINRVGARVWELIDGMRSVDAIAGQIATEFEQDEGRVLAEVSRFVEQLQACALVQLAAPTGGAT